MNIEEMKEAALRVIEETDPDPPKSNVIGFPRGRWRDVDNGISPAESAFRALIPNRYLPTVSKPLEGVVLTALVPAKVSLHNAHLGGIED